MQRPNGYSIDSAHSEESEDGEPLIENDAGVFIFIAGKMYFYQDLGLPRAKTPSSKFFQSYLYLRLWLTVIFIILINR